LYIKHNILIFDIVTQTQNDKVILQYCIIYFPSHNYIYYILIIIIITILVCIIILTIILLRWRLSTRVKMHQKHKNRTTATGTAIEHLSQIYFIRHVRPQYELGSMVSGDSKGGGGVL